VRAVLSGFFVAAPGMIVLRHWLVVTARLRPDDPANQWFIIAQAAVVLATAAIVTGALRWTFRRGLSTDEAVRVLFGATTASSHWSAPSIARLLTPAAGRVRPPERDTPADYRRAIGDLLPILPSASGLVSAAATMADRILRAIEQCDSELRSLANDANAKEVDRLAAQLGALGDASAIESRERRELRELVRHQLEVVRRMRGRHEMVWQQRAHLFDMLRGLWTQLCAACDAVSVSTEARNQGLERARALCAEIAAELDRSPSGLAAPDSPVQSHADATTTAASGQRTTI
jgi:hypothetical protein